MKKAKFILGTLLFTLSVIAVGCNNKKNKDGIYHDLIINEINELNQESLTYPYDSISFIDIDSISTLPRILCDFEDTNIMSMLYPCTPSTLNKIKNNYQSWVNEVKDIDTSELKITGYGQYKDTVIVIKINTWKNGYFVKKSAIFIPYNTIEGRTGMLTNSSIGKVNDYFNTHDSEWLTFEKRRVAEIKAAMLELISANPTINDFEEICSKKGKE